MIELHVWLAAGGTANWSTPIRVDESTWRANFETFFVHRYTFDDGRRVHVKTRYAGIDDVSAEGDVVSGFASTEGVDEDGDWLCGKIEFVISDDPNDQDWGKGVYTFLFGTGKWKDVSGSVTTTLWAQPEDRDQEMPPPGPIRFWGFLEGEGELTLPHLGS